MNFLISSTIMATIGVAAATATHGVSRNSHLLGFYRLDERSSFTNFIAFFAKWVCLLAAVLWLWLNQRWWIALLLTIFGLIASNIVILSLPRERTRGMPCGKPALVVACLLAIGCTADSYVFTYLV
jgi:amino acid transporter